LVVKQQRGVHVLHVHSYYKLPLQVYDRGRITSLIITSLRTTLRPLN